MNNGKTYKLCRYTDKNPRSLIKNKKELPYIKNLKFLNKSNIISFPDSSNISIISDKSLINLNNKLNNKGVELTNIEAFRPNIFIDNISYEHKEDE